MFTNKTSRREQTSHSRQQSIEPFEEEDTADADGTVRETHRRGSTSGYMAELDEWLDETVFEPIKRAAESRDAEELELACIRGSNLIKRKVLASYHNGLKAKTSTNQKTYGQQNYRRN